MKNEAESKAENKAGKRKRRFRGLALLVLMSLALVFAGLWVLYFSPFFDVDKITFSGIANASLDEISSITDEFSGKPLASVDIDSASERIRELPWVKEVKINRSWWGGDISVSVIERTPVAVQAAAKGYALISRDGKILQNVSQKGRFPLVEGVSEWSQSAEPVLETAERLSAAPDIADQVRAVVVAESGELYLDLNQGGWIRLGDTKDLPDKLRSARTVLQNVGVRCDQVLDVRSPLATAMTSGYDCQV